MSDAMHEHAQAATGFPSLGSDRENQDRSARLHLPQETRTATPSFFHSIWTVARRLARANVRDVDELLEGSESSSKNATRWPNEGPTLPHLLCAWTLPDDNDLRFRGAFAGDNNGSRERATTTGRPS